MTFPALPQRLAGESPQGGSPGDPIAQFEIGELKNFVYLVIDWSRKRAAWVDPQADLREPLAFLVRHKLALDAILLTHTHHDHIAGVPELVSRFPDASLRVHSGDARRLSAALQRRAKPVGDGELISIGDLTLKALHTPGHSAGEVSYLVQTKPPCLLTGDTVFIRDCGRTDFESGSNEQMFESLQRIKKLPPETIILPGHHYKKECASTIGRELIESPPFRCGSVEELASLP